jgi:Flp pilus assembly pilin Flp
MNIINDENGQGAAEYILLFGGVIVVAIAALILYNNWIRANTLTSNADINKVRTSVV